MPKYDPEKTYSWNPQGIVTMTGQQFASFYHLLTQEMNERGGAPVSLKVEAFQVMMKVFTDGVETGQMYEVKEAAPETLPKASEDASVNKLFPIT